MTSTSNFSLPSPAKQRSAVNPFAQALADAEREKQGQGGAAFPGYDDSLLTDAMAQSGGQWPDQNPQALAEQQRQWEEQQRQQRLAAERSRLHKEINPVDLVDVFNAREQQVQKELEETRYQLQMLEQEVKSFHKEIDLSLSSNIAEPGQTGSYYRNFFHQLRQFIMMLRQRVHSARTWLAQSQVKAKKKKAKAGMMIDGQQYEQTTTVQDMMHHERSSQYSGG